MDYGDIRLYICTHKDFKYYPSDNHYKIICGEGNLKNSYKLNVVEETANKYSPMQKSLGEISRYYHVWKNIDFKKHKYIGFCQYRRYWEFYNNIPNLDWDFSIYDIITCAPNICNVQSQYDQFHNLDDYKLIRSIIKVKFGITEETLVNYESQLIQYNMFIMKSEEFDSYCNFLFTVLDEYINYMKFHSMDDIRNHILSNWDKYYKNGASLEYQERLLGFLAERITNIWIQHNHNKIGTKRIIQKNYLSYDGQFYWAYGGPHELKVMVCCLAKNENAYIREFIDYYKKLGVDKILIYDNNDSYGGENLLDVIQKDVDDNYVTIVNYHDKDICQLEAYNDCLHGLLAPNYDWILFIDVDEYVCLYKHDNIKEYLNEFPPECDRIAINWMTMDDNDLVENDGRPLMERFTRAIPADAYWECTADTGIRENRHIKSIVRCVDLQKKVFINPHFCTGCNQVRFNDNTLWRGEMLTSYSPENESINWNWASLKHFRVKTITEYLYNKILKGACDISDKKYIETRCTAEKFFRINKITTAKKKVLYNFYKQYPLYKFRREPDYSLAYMNHTEILNAIIKDRNYTSYLEIGIFNGYNYNEINCPFKECSGMYNIGEDVNCFINYVIQPENLFNQIPIGKKYDLIFINQVKDSKIIDKLIMQALNYLNANGMICIHNTMPPKKYTVNYSKKYQSNIPYVGDSFKSVCKLFKTNLEYCTIQNDDAGMSIIKYNTINTNICQIVLPCDYDGIFSKDGEPTKLGKDILKVISIEEFEKRFNIA